MKFELFIGLLVLGIISISTIGMGDTIYDTFGPISSQEISNPSEIYFNCDETIEGNVSAINASSCRTISPKLSYRSNIHIGSGELHERTAAIKGHYKSQDFKNFGYRQQDLFDLITPSIDIRGILAVSSWDAHRTIEYSGKEINDRDYSSSLFSKTSTLFLYNKNLMKDRRFASAESDSLEANTTGITDLKFNNSFSNQEYVINEQRYYGKFNTSINPKSYSYENYNYGGDLNITTNSSIDVIEPIDNVPYYDQGWLDDFCKVCWPGCSIGYIA